MTFGNEVLSRRAVCITVICLSFGASSGASSQSVRPQPSSQQNAAPARLVGAIKFISGNTITLTTNAGTDLTVQVQDTTRFLRIAPGQKDLKDATPILLTDIQTGDRILVRGKLADEGKAVLADSIIAMKKADIAEKQSRDREEWQKHGLGGLVSSVDAASGTIAVLANRTASPEVRFLLQPPIGASICRYRSISKSSRIPPRGGNEEAQKDFGQGNGGAPGSTKLRSCTGCHACHS
jgi:hypothetical protein